MDSSKKKTTEKQTKYGGFIDNCDCYHLAAFILRCERTAANTKITELEKLLLC